MQNLKFRAYNGLHFLRIFFVASLIGGCSAAWSAVSCVSLFNTLEVVSHQEFAKEFQNLIQSGFAVDSYYDRMGALSNNPSAPFANLPPNAKNILDYLPKLSASARLSYRLAVLASPVRSFGSAQYKHLVLLGLHDQHAWLDLPTLIENFSSANGLRYFVNIFADGLPSELKNQVLAEFGKKYFDYEKSGMLDQLGSKRLADLFFKTILRGDTLIKDQIAKGVLPVKAFENYLYEVRKYIPNQNLLEFPQLLNILKLLRASFLTHFPHRHTLYIGGSAVNGREKVRTSDIDVGLAEPLETRAEVQEFQSKLNNDLKSYVQNFSPNGGLEVSVTRDRPVTWGLLHPVAMRLDQDGVHLLIYSPDHLEPISFHLF